MRPCVRKRRSEIGTYNIDTNKTREKERAKPKVEENEQEAQYATLEKRERHHYGR